MALAKAYLLIEGSTAGAATGDRIDCLFNPTQIAYSLRNGWKSDKKTGVDAPAVHFIGSSPGSFHLDLIFDTTDTGESVATTYIDQLTALMAIKSSVSGTDEDSGNARPPVVSFNWADFHTPPGVIESMDVTYNYFASNGTPLRAKVSISIKQFKAQYSYGAQNPTSGTPRPHRVHRVQPGETLDRISARYYGDSTRWRQLANANGIEDPLALRPGSLLAIPRMDST
ncbi:MAG: LysM peptidoglycan-binding domain-containing protein [Actinomycetia bacterium]|nr:LysM peptidoglycan-binding domain-containing protein [Actinomycetes bacterium]